MESFETKEAAQFTFEPFAAHPFYTAINRSLVQQTLALLASRPRSVPLMIVDLACGTGAITRLIAEELPDFPCSARIIAVDPSTEALRRAQTQMEQSTIPVEFLRGEAADLPRLVSSADAVFSAMPSISSLTRVRPFGTSRLFWHREDSLRVTVPSTKERARMRPCASVACGYVAR